MFLRKNKNRILGQMLLKHAVSDSQTRSVTKKAIKKIMKNKIR